MLSGTSKRMTQKRLKTLFERGGSPAVKSVALSCTSRSSFRPDAPFANQSRPVAPVRAYSRTVHDFVACRPVAMDPVCGRGRCAFGHRGDRPAHRALVRPRRALVFRVLARPGVHGGVQRDRRRGVRGLRVAAHDRVLRRSRSDRNRGPVGLQRRGHRRRSGPARRHRSHAGRKGPRGLAAAA